MSDLAQWLRGQAAHRTETDPYYLLFEAGALDAKDAELARLRTENEALAAEIEDWRSRLATQCGETLAAEARAEKAGDDMRTAYEGVTHTLMVLPVPERSDQKRAYGSLVDAKQTLDAALASLPTENKDA